MKSVCAFWDDIEDDGWAKVTRMHHQPDKLDAATMATGAVITPSRAPTVKPGWGASLWVNPTSGAHEWRVEMEATFRMPAGEYLTLLPAPTRVQARQAAETDPVIADFLKLIDMLVADNAATGIHPGSRGSRECLGYLVFKGFLTQEAMDEIVNP